MRSIFCYLFAIGLFACTTESSQQFDKETPKKEKKQFEMYEHSEMASAMLFFYSHFELLKSATIAGESLGEPSQQLALFHTAEMTEGKHRNDDFSDYLESFEISYVSLFTDTIADEKQAFNAAVRACVQCHQFNCTGPIPKIEKLYIP